MINIFFYFVIFTLGLAVGSFLNCVIWRLETRESFLKGRSYCPHCKHKLFWQDLIPVLSFLFLKGKCRYCQQKISWQYPLVEIITAFLFLFILFKSFSAEIDLKRIVLIYYWIIPLIFYWVIVCFMIVIFVYDLKHFIIPDKIIFPAIVIAFLYQLFRVFIGPCPVPPTKAGLFTIFAPALTAAAFFLIIFLISSGKWIGFGDVKLGFFMGLLLGFPNIIVALFLSFLFGAIIGIGLIIAQKKTLKSEVPFGPFLVVGTFTALFFGEKMVNWYLGLFLM